VGAPIGIERHRPYRHGFGLDPDDPSSLALEEPLELIARLRALGVRLVNTSLGSPYYSPHLIRPATHPPSDGYLPPEDPLLGVQRHLRVARAVKAAFPDLVVIGSGWSYLQEWLANVAEWEIGRGHADFAGLGRMMLSYPELPLDVLAGRPLDRRRICRTFSDCTSAPRNGLVSGCYPLDPWYRALPERETLQAIKREWTRRHP
jgi:2,4-dienoyl-CoA reductase-like NADH-dependent reductase (Old Yellow Enzyme family)